MPSYKLNTLTERQRDILITALKNYKADVSHLIGEEKYLYASDYEQTIEYYGSEFNYNAMIEKNESKLEDINYLLSQLETPIGA